VGGGGSGGHGRRRRNGCGKRCFARIIDILIRWKT
jgi:hypothetical protein